MSHAIREAVFAEYLYGDTGLLYDSSKKYSMDATTTDTAKVDVYNILREKLELPSEGTNAAPRTVISESIDTGEGHKSNIVHHLAELAPQTETSAINIKRQAYYDGTVKYGENYYGQEVCYA
ncbi:MAG: hypothetical protein RR214_04565 [Synergistaceae bacterium]